jgi:hypothetical protein
VRNQVIVRRPAILCAVLFIRPASSVPHRPSGVQSQYHRPAYFLTSPEHEQPSAHLLCVQGPRETSWYAPQSIHCSAVTSSQSSIARLGLKTEAGGGQVSCWPPGRDIIATPGTQVTTRNIHQATTTTTTTTGSATATAVCSSSIALFLSLSIYLLVY